MFRFQLHPGPLVPRGRETLVSGVIGGKILFGHMFGSVVPEKQLNILLETGKGHFELVLQSHDEQ